MSGTLHNALLRPAILQILRASGFHQTTPSVLDTVTDLAIRYLDKLSLLCVKHAASSHNANIPGIGDVRMALHEIGALRPQMSGMEEGRRGTVRIGNEIVPFEDLRGIEAFLGWARGPMNREIRRIAGVMATTATVPVPAATGAATGAEAAEVPVALDEFEDYVTGLKKKYNKAGEDSRYQGTVLGKEADAQPVTILGGPIGSIQEWNAQMRAKHVSSDPSVVESAGGTPLSSSPLTPMDYLSGEDEEIGEEVGERESGGDAGEDSDTPLMQMQGA